MLLQNHTTYSAVCLDTLTLPDEVRYQIFVGATANDLCELTNEAQIFIKKPPAQHAKGMLQTMNFVSDGIALYQSHRGKLASMHAMAKSANEPASSTLDELKAWFDLLNMLSTQPETIEKANQIVLSNTKLRELFGNGRITFGDIVDTDDVNITRYRSIGMMLHLIQDSYTISHCKRDKEGKLEKFYWYEAQDSGNHKIHDDVAPEHKTKMLHECLVCLNNVLTKKKYDYTSLLDLSPMATNSDGGDFAKQPD